MDNSEKVGAVIVAAGQSRRMNGIDKVLAPLGGKPVLVRAVSVFQACRLIDQIVVVLAEQNLSLGRKLVRDEGWSKVSGIYPGGRRRQDSVAAGLKELDQCAWVIIHEGARPLVTEDLICRGLLEAKETGASSAAVPVTDTVKIAGEDMLVRDTPRRRELWAAQAPQVFRFDIIASAYRQVKAEVTDDATLVEKLGYRVKLYLGAYDNLKITTPTDLVLAEALWQKREKNK